MICQGKQGRNQLAFHILEIIYESFFDSPSQNAVFDALATKAPTNNPTLTGTVTVPTPTNGTDAVNKTYADTVVDAIPEITEGPGINLTDLGGGVTQISTEAIDIQEFTADGIWTKPGGAKYVLAYLWGGGGGGGGGRRGAVSSQRSGGGGGAGGHYSFAQMPASLLSNTEAVTVGAGGTAGTAVGSGSGDGGNGGAGGTSKFGPGLDPHAAAAGGNGGGGGTSTVATTGGAGGGGIFASFVQATILGSGGSSGAGSANAATPTFGQQAPHAGTGIGTGGGSIDASNTKREGSVGSTVTGAAGGVYNTSGDGGNGADQSIIISGGAGSRSGGGGGAGGGVDIALELGKNGGNGGIPGGGGGGGGGGTNTGGGGAGNGGAGGRGFVRIVTIF